MHKMDFKGSFLFQKHKELPVYDILLVFWSSIVRFPKKKIGWKSISWAIFSLVFIGGGGV
jgi:hypothetical protein